MGKKDNQPEEERSQYKRINKNFILTYYDKDNPDHKYEMVPAEDISKLAKTGRSNCILDTSKLQSEGVQMRPAAEVIQAYLKVYKKTF